MSDRRCIAFEHQKLIAVWRGLGEDIFRYLNKSPENQAAGDTWKSRLSAILTPHFMALFLYRIAHYLYLNRWHRAASLVSSINCVSHKVWIPPQSCIGPSCLLPHPAGVTFCGTAGRDLTLYSLAVCCPREPFLDGSTDAGPRLGDRVTIGAHAVVIGPVNVNDDVKVAFSVRLDSDAPAGVLVVSKALRIAVRSRLTASGMGRVGVSQP